MKAYKVIYNNYTPLIKEVEVQEFAVYYVVLDGKRDRIRTHFYAWFKTKEEAMEYLLNYAKICVIQAERDLEIAKKYFNKVEQYINKSHE